MPYYKMVNIRRLCTYRIFPQSFSHTSLGLRPRPVLKNKKKKKKKRQKSEPAKGDSDHAIQIRCRWQASMNPCSSIPSPEGDSQPLEELTRRLWGRDPKALAYEAAYAGDGVHSGVAQPSKSFDGKREK